MTPKSAGDTIYLINQQYQQTNTTVLTVLHQQYCVQYCLLVCYHIQWRQYWQYFTYHSIQYIVYNNTAVYCTQVGIPYTQTDTDRRQTTDDRRTTV